MLSAGPTTVIGNDHMHPVVTIPVLIDDAQNLQTFYFDLAFDPVLLRPVHFTDLGTDFATATLMGGGMLTCIMGFSLSGLLAGVSDSMNLAITGLTGPGVLVNIHFEALAPGISALTLCNVSLNLSQSGFTLAPGQVCISGTTVDCRPANPVSEPDITMFIALAAMFSWASRRLALNTSGVGKQSQRLA